MAARQPIDCPSQQRRQTVPHVARPRAAARPPFTCPRPSRRCTTTSLSFRGTAHGRPSIARRHGPDTRLRSATARGRTAARGGPDAGASPGPGTVSVRHPSAVAARLVAVPAARAGQRTLRGGDDRSGGGTVRARPACRHRSAPRQFARHGPGERRSLRRVPLQPARTPRLLLARLPRVLDRRRPGRHVVALPRGHHRHRALLERHAPADHHPDPDPRSPPEPRSITAAPAAPTASGT
jgi:hypothetical protein